MSSPFSIAYDAPPTVARYMASHAKMRVIKGPQGSGKSSGSVMEILRRMQEQEPDFDGARRSRWLIVRNTMPQLKLTTIKTFLDWIPDGTLGVWRETEKTYRFRFNDVEAEAIFLALDTADDVAKLLSLESTGCYFNEFREISSEIYEGMTRRVGRYPSKKGGPGPTWYGIWADTNPPRVGSWHHRMMENLDENLDPLPERTDAWAWDVYHQPSGRSDEAENIENLPPGYYDTEGLTPAYVTTMIDGEYGPSLDGLPVFAGTFSNAVHVSQESLLWVERAPMLAGLDAGLTPAIVFAQELPSGKVNVVGNVSLVKGETMGMERFLKDRVLPFMRANYPGLNPQQVTISADPACWQRGQANEVTVAEVISRFGFRVLRAPTNDLEPRISAVENLLQRRVGHEVGLRVDKACRALINALEFGYIFKKKKDGNAQDTPDKNEHSHIADAFQYLCLMLGGAAYNLASRRSVRREVKPPPRRIV